MSLYPNIDLEMDKKNITYPVLADAIGLHPMAVYRRLRGISEWKLSEAVQVADFFGCSDMPKLFLRLDTKS